jgi:hypothetical protein
MFPSQVPVGPSPYPKFSFIFQSTLFCVPFIEYDIRETKKGWSESQKCCDLEDSGGGRSERIVLSAPYKQIAQISSRKWSLQIGSHEKRVQIASNLSHNSQRTTFVFIGEEPVPILT